MLRGWIHQETFFFALGAFAITLAQTKNHLAFIGCLIYAFSQLFLFGMSAIYHRPHWSPGPRAILKRIDHCAIFISIAGSFTPVGLLALSETTGTHLLLFVWGATALGFLQSIFWVKAPKWVSGILYVAVGWLIFPYLHELGVVIGQTDLCLMLAGGLAYTLGAVFYALKKPNFKPGVFGYHELFHALTVLGAGLVFVAIYHLVV